MRRFLKFILLIPVAIVLLLLAVANRGPVLLSFDPISPAEPMFSLRAPLFVLLLICVMFGVLLGGLGTWLTQGHHRKNARRLRAEADRMRVEAGRSQAGQAGRVLTSR
jgi:uncharacterized integral membrane protein